MGSAGTVKADAGQIGRIGRQEKVSVASWDEGENQQRVHTYVQRNGHDNSDCCCLGVNQLGSQEEHDCICQRIGLHCLPEEFF